MPDGRWMNDDNLQWLMQWYLSQCDNDWEHTWGIDIGNLDNPGWSLSIDLLETELEKRPFERVEHGEPSDDLDEWKRTGSWWVADVTDGKFKASCGPLDLSSVIKVFRDWASATG